MGAEHMVERRAMDSRAAIWATRIAFALVFIVNVQCALSFALWPGNFVEAYELSDAGVAGEAAICGIGIAFLMWNVTYPPFIAKPARFSVLGWIILAQQAVGFVGESALLFTLPAGHELLASSLTRFIAFDSAGLVIMAATFIWLLIAARRENQTIRMVE